MAIDYHVGSYEGGLARRANIMDRANQTQERQSGKIYKGLSDLGDAFADMDTRQQRQQQVDLTKQKRMMEDALSTHSMAVATNERRYYKHHGTSKAAREAYDNRLQAYYRVLGDVDDPEAKNQVLTTHFADLSSGGRGTGGALSAAFRESGVTPTEAKPHVLTYGEWLKVNGHINEEYDPTKADYSATYDMIKRSANVLFPEADLENLFDLVGRRDTPSPTVPPSTLVNTTGEKKQIPKTGGLDADELVETLSKESLEGGRTKIETTDDPYLRQDRENLGIKVGDVQLPLSEVEETNPELLSDEDKVNIQQRKLGQAQPRTAIEEPHQKNENRNYPREASKSFVENVKKWEGDLIRAPKPDGYSDQLVVGYGNILPLSRQEISEALSLEYPDDDQRSARVEQIYKVYGPGGAWKNLKVKDRKVVGSIGLVGSSVMNLFDDKFSTRLADARYREYAASIYNDPNNKWLANHPSGVRQAVYHLAFVTGKGVLKDFKRMNDALKEGDYDKAAMEVRESKFGRGGLTKDQYDDWLKNEHNPEWKGKRPPYKGNIDRALQIASDIASGRGGPPESVGSQHGQQNLPPPEEINKSEDGDNKRKSYWGFLDREF